MPPPSSRGVRNRSQHLDSGGRRSSFENRPAIFRCQEPLRSERRRCCRSSVRESRGWERRTRGPPHRPHGVHVRDHGTRRHRGYSPRVPGGRDAACGALSGTQRHPAPVNCQSGGRGFESRHPAPEAPLLGGVSPSREPLREARPARSLGDAGRPRAIPRGRARGPGWESASPPVMRLAGAHARSASGFTTLIGEPCSNALIWSKTSPNCTSHSSRVT